MSLSEILGSAMSGLTAAQAGLRTVSNNAANVNTPGYARERLTLSTGVTAGRVTGVITGEPERIADRFLELNAYRRASDVGSADARNNYLDQLQGLLGAPGNEAGLSARLDAIGTSAIAMTSSQSFANAAAIFAGNIDDALHTMQQLDSDVSALRGDVESEVTETVRNVNSLLVRINDLNDTVSRLDGLGRSSAGAADQRQSALDELSGLVKVTIRDQPDGRVTIDTASGTALLDRRLRLLSYPESSTGTSQPVYAPINIRFANLDGSIGASTGTDLDATAVGGKLGGLLDLRDHDLPAFSTNLAGVFAGLAESLNAASNAGTAVPPPGTLDGQQTGLIGSDRLRFTGKAIFAVVATDGTLTARTAIDFGSLGASATVDDAVNAINAGLAGAATAGFSGGRLTLTAAALGTGVAVAQDPATPSDRGGVGFSQYFGLNNIVKSERGSLVPTGFTASDPHGFGPGETAGLVLRNASGRVLTSYTLTGSVGPTMGDLVGELNSSPLATFGSFAVDSRGRVAFTPGASASGAALTIISDSTDRYGTGRSFSSLSGLSDATSGLSNGTVDSTILANPRRLPLARLDLTATIGGKVVGAGDVRGAATFSDQLARTIDLGRFGRTTVDKAAATLIGGTGIAAARAGDTLADAGARRLDAVNRRDSFSGVNIDEELAQMVVLQNSYSASARVISTASQMYDTLLAMLG